MKKEEAGKFAAQVGQWLSLRLYNRDQVDEKKGGEREKREKKVTTGARKKKQYFKLPR